MRWKSVGKIASVVAGGGAAAAAVPTVGDCLPYTGEVSEIQILVAIATIATGLAGLFSKRPQDTEK